MLNKAVTSWRTRSATCDNISMFSGWAMFFCGVIRWLSAQCEHCALMPRGQITVRWNRVDCLLVVYDIVASNHFESPRTSCRCRFAKGGRRKRWFANEIRKRLASRQLNTVKCCDFPDSFITARHHLSPLLGIKREHKNLSLLRYTHLKLNIDTQNCHIWKEMHFWKPSFLWYPC